MTNLNGKVAVITGARKGMGRSHALTLAKAGVKVVVADISLEDCQKVVEEIKKNGGEPRNSTKLSLRGKQGIGYISGQ